MTAGKATGAVAVGTTGGALLGALSGIAGGPAGVAVGAAIGAGIGAGGIGASGLAIIVRGVLQHAQKFSKKVVIKVPHKASQ